MDITYPSGTVTQNGNTFLFTPALPLQVSTTYQLSMDAVTDLSGNVSTPVNRTFTTAGTSAYDYTSLTIVSTSPANGDVGIPINNPIAVTFNKAVDPTTVSTATFGITTTGFPVLGSFPVSGNVVTFTPSQPWPAASSVTFQPGLGYYGAMQDLYGNKLESFTSYSFKTVAPTDTTPPQLTALIPAPGTTLVSPVALFRMTFSKTVSTGNKGLDIFVGSQLVNSSAVYDLEDPLSLLTSANITATSGQVTLVGSSAIVDRSGNSLVPFSDTYSVLNYSVLQSVYVTQNGVTFAGTLAMQNSNQSVQFTASAPFAAGTVINVFVLPTAADPYGLTIYGTFTSNFTVASASTPAAVQSTSFARTAAPNGALEVFFDQPLKPETVNGENVWLRTGKRAVAGNVSLRGDRIVRFVPAARMDASLEYSLTMAPGLQALTSGRVQPQEFPLAWRKAPM